MIATDPPSLRFFPYRPRLGGQLAAVFFFGLCAAVLAHASSGPDALEIRGLRLSPGQAAVFYRVLSGLSCAMVAAALVNVVRRAVGHRRIVLGLDFISVPDASSPTHERRVPFGEIADVTCTAVVGQRFLQLSLRDGTRKTIAAGMLPGDADFEAVVAALTRATRRTTP